MIFGINNIKNAIHESNVIKAVAEAKNLDADATNRLTKEEIENALVNKGYGKETASEAAVLHAEAVAKQANASATRQLTAEEIKQKLVNDGINADDAESLIIKGSKITTNYAESESIRVLTQDTINKAVANGILSESEGNLLLNTINNTTANVAEGLSHGKVTAAKLAEAVANGTLSASEAAVIAKSKGITLANIAKTGSFKLLTAAILENIKAFAAWLTTPIGMTVAATAAVVGLVAVVNKIKISSEEAKEALSETQSKLDEVTSKYEDNLKRIKELEDLETLSITDQEDLDRLKAENEELRIRKEYLDKEAARKKDQVVKSAKSEFYSKYGDVSNIQEAKQHLKTTGNNDSVKYFKNLENYQKYQDNKSEAIANGDAKAIEKWNKKLKETEEKLIDTREDVQGLYDDLRNNGASEEELAPIVAMLRTIDNLLLNTSEKLSSFIESNVVESDKEKLMELASNGELTADILSKEFSSVNDYISENEISIEDLISYLKTLQKEIKETGNAAENLSFTDRISKVENLSTGFDQLDKIYADVKDGKEFDYSSILNNEDFKNTFGSYTEEYDKFIKTITNSPKDIKACQQAFNDLSTAYIYNQDALKNVTEETKESTILMLKQMGIVNAEEVVTSALAKTTAHAAAEIEFLTIAEEKGINVSKNLTDATYQEIAAIIGEGTASQETQSYLANLALEKLNVNNMKIDTRSDIDNIIGIANAAGTSAEYLGALSKALSYFQTASQSGGILAKEWANLQLASVLSQIKKTQLKSSEFYAPVKYGGGSVSNSGSGGSGSGSGSETEETFDWIETKISRLEREIENLGQTADASYKLWADRNSALADEMSKVTDEIKVQQQAYDYYMNKANSVGLSSTYQNFVKNGAIKIETLKDEKLIDKINSYKEWYEKALDCKDAIRDLNDELANLARQKFDNISSEFENLMSVVEHELNMLDAYISQTEERGRFVSTKYYSSMIALEKQNIALLESEYAKLNASLNEAVNSGQIQKYSEEWYNMAGEINSVSEELVEANTSIIEFQNSIRDLEWEVFDKLQEFISQIQGESEFLQELMSDEKMFSDEGSITEYGRATLGLHAVNYETYMRQASDYAEELKKINKEIAEDPNNLTLLERRQELLEAQRDMISSTEDEKQAMKDLIEEGYNTFLDYMQELIDKRKEAMQSIKDLYDYEKNVSEQTDEIARLQKIIDSYGGDNSEETKAKLQEYTVQLQDAKEALEETEYERYLSDQEEMLDTIVSETEEWINARLDNLDGLVKGVIDSTNENAKSIRETLESETEKVGMTLTDEMNSIWSTDGSAGKVVAMYGNGFNSHLTTISSTLSGIKDYIYSMVKESDKEATSDIDKVQNGNAANPPTSSENNTKPNTSTTTTKPTTSTSSSANSNSKWGSWFIKKKNYVSKSKLKKDSSIVDFNESTLNTLNCGKTLRA